MKTHLHTLLALVTLAGLARGAEPDLASRLESLDISCIAPGSEQARKAERMLYEDARTRLREANREETRRWRAVKTREDWERFRDPRIDALRRSLGTLPDEKRNKEVTFEVTGQIKGDGYRIENVVIANRPGLPVTANLYVPEPARESMPGILIFHSHHAPKTQGELQDMGIAWARCGCLVLVMDQLGHGERRQHPFVDSSSYAGTFRPTRQDYYFRYNTGIQLHLAGESLIGWMAGDMMRGVDFLLGERGADPKRIILLGAVAGGGDPAGVTAAVDPRVSAVVPFNFGGPQPETVYPLPEDAEDSFLYTGGGSWESTRNLRLSARDGFAPWVIVGSVVPRRIVYGHEFSWDRERDPVWKRFQKLQEFYGVEHLASAHGRGKVTQSSSEATHCTNIGAVHRTQFYPDIKRWFDIDLKESKESKRYSVQELTCLTPEARKKFAVRTLAEELHASQGARVNTIREELHRLAPDAMRAELRKRWTEVLGDVTPIRHPKTSSEGRGGKIDETARAEHVLMHVERDVVVPISLLLPVTEKKAPVVVVVGQEGKQAFLKQHAREVAECLRAGVAVCLVDVRGTGETRAGSARGRNSSATSISSTELMLGQTLVGSRLRDLRSALNYLRSHDAIDGKRIAVWGASLAKVNADGEHLRVPLDAERMPAQAEPLGGLLALLAGLFEDDLKAVCVQRGLVGYLSVLESQFVYIPHDAVIPGVLGTGDVLTLASSLAPRPLRMEELVDGLNRKADLGGATGTAVDRLKAAYRKADAADSLAIHQDAPEQGVAAWLAARLRE